MTILCILFRLIEPLNTVIDVNSRASTHVNAFERTNRPMTSKHVNLLCTLQNMLKHMNIHEQTCNYNQNTQNTKNWPQKQEFFYFAMHRVNLRFVRVNLECASGLIFGGGCKSSPLLIVQRERGELLSFFLELFC